GLVLLVGIRYWLGRYGLLIEGSGVRYPLGYTDVHARLPARNAMAFLSVVTAGALLYGAWRRSWLPASISTGALVLGAVLAGFLYPALVQKFQVEPNQFAKESTYIRWNTDFTRRAFDLHPIERRRFPYRAGTIPPWEALDPFVAALPLWDLEPLRAFGLHRLERRALPHRAGRLWPWEALEPLVAALPLSDLEPLRAVYNQTQSILGYYHFPGVDYDRYGPPGGTRTQVALAVRE